jgi:formylglycine-generating enzyme required for sulfatase activity
MVQVAGGSFDMGKELGTAGSGDIENSHTVTLTGFNMSKYQVTQEQYQAVMGKTIVEQQALATMSTTNYGRGNNYPMYYVSWYDALVFCNKLSIAEGLSPAYSINGKTDPAEWGTVPTSSNATWNAAVIIDGSNGYRLPTEAQWEYAAKGGNTGETFTYAGSDTVGDVAWYTSNSGNTTHEVGTKAPNGLGLYDMSGNVSEWCWDWRGDYTSEAASDPMGPSAGSYRVNRGGSWYYSAGRVRSVYRFDDYPHDRNSSIGFRLVRP